MVSIHLYIPYSDSCETELCKFINKDNYLTLLGRIKKSPLKIYTRKKFIKNGKEALEDPSFYCELKNRVELNELMASLGNEYPDLEKYSDPLIGFWFMGKQDLKELSELFNHSTCKILARRLSRGNYIEVVMIEGIENSKIELKTIKDLDLFVKFLNEYA